MGLVKVTIPQFNDPTRSQNMYALFHIEDVYDSSGKKLVQTNCDVNVGKLKNRSVDLICRSIARGSTCTEIKSLLDKIKSGDEYKDATIPLLQAVAVFLKPKERDLKQTITGAAPLPTFLRLEPANLDRKQFYTSFYLNIKLRYQLDSKVFEYMNSCNNVIRNHLKKFQHPWFLDQNQQVKMRKEIPSRILGKIGSLDTHRDIKYDFGYFNPATIEPPSIAGLPHSFRRKGAAVKLLWFDRPAPKYGLVVIDLEGNLGSVYAFFSNRVINTKRYMAESSDIVWKNIKYLMVNADLMDSKSKIPYCVNEMWIIGDQRSDYKPPADLHSEWKKITPIICNDRNTLSFRAFESVHNRFAQRIKK